MIVERSGYQTCDHLYCFAIIIGEVGDLCDDCRGADDVDQEGWCSGCDNDSDVLVKGEA